MGPMLCAFAIGFVYPFCKGVYLSFCKFKTTSDAQFIGFGNYIKALNDASFVHSFWYTALFALVSLVFINVLAFAVAYALTQGIKGSNLFRTVFFMPNLIGGIVLGYMWSMIFDGILSRYGTSILLRDEIRLLGPHHPHVLAAGRLYDDHLHCRLAGCARGYARGREDRRREPLADTLEGHHPERDALHHHLHLPHADEQLQALRPEPRPHGRSAPSSSSPTAQPSRRPRCWR